MLTDITSRLKGHQLKDLEYAFLLSEDTTGERMAIHCEATSFDQDKADLRTLVAIPIRGNRILTSQHLVLNFWPTEPPEPALARFLHAIGSRPLVGYYLNFTMEMLDRYVRSMIGIPLPNPRIEVSSLYYDSRVKVPGKNAIDLRLSSILRELDLPERGGNDACSVALAAAMVYLRLNPPRRV
jgi:DNA polymerase-3 subunit epsilon